MKKKNTKNIFESVERKENKLNWNNLKQLKCRCISLFYRKWFEWFR